MHGPMNVKFISAKHAKETYQYMQFLAPGDGRKDRPKHVQRFTRINNLRNRCILLVVL